MEEKITQTNDNSTSAGPADLLTVREAYLRLRISKWKLYDLIRSRKLVTIQIGRRRLVPVDAVRVYIQQLARESLA
jgi:excisionase family DNA binding protein